MKKILLGTTTLIGAATLFAGAALAETPKITLGGFADFQVGIANDDQDANQRSQAFRSDTEVTLRIDGKTDGGLGYGGGVNLEADVDGNGTAPTAGTDSDNQGLNASATWVYVDGAWGRVELGSNVGAQGTMKVDASNIARATGGIDGDYTYYANSSAQFLATPDLYLGYGLTNLGNEAKENLNKATYYTPRFAGFQLGVSYIVNSIDRGQSVTRADRNNTATAENIFAGGVSYDNKFGDVGFAVAATGETGQAEACATTAGACTAGATIYEDLRTWNVGAKLSYMGFSLAGSYGDLGDSLRVKTLNADNSHYWTVGGAYEYGPFGVSVTYLDSEYDNGGALGHNDFQNLSVGTDYKLAPGLTPYAEVSFFEQEAPGVVNDNDGTVFIAGTQLTF